MITLRYLLHVLRLVPGVVLGAMALNHTVSAQTQTSILDAAEKTCSILLSEATSLRVSSLVNKQMLTLKMKMRERAPDDVNFNSGNQLQSIVIVKGADSYAIPQNFVRSAYQTTCLFSLGENQIGFLVTLGSGEKTSQVLYRINTSNWEVILEAYAYPTWIYKGASKGVLIKELQ